MHWYDHWWSWVMGGMVLFWILLFIALLSLIVWAVRTRAARSRGKPGPEPLKEAAPDRKEAQS